MDLSEADFEEIGSLVGGLLVEGREDAEVADIGEYEDDEGQRDDEDDGAGQKIDTTESYGTYGIVSDVQQFEQLKKEKEEAEARASELMSTVSNIQAETKEQKAAFMREKEELLQSNKELRSESTELQRRNAALVAEQAETTEQVKRLRGNLSEAARAQAENARALAREQDAAAGASASSALAEQQLSALHAQLADEKAAAAAAGARAERAGDIATEAAAAATEADKRAEAAESKLRASQAAHEATEQELQNALGAASTAGEELSKRVATAEALAANYKAELLKVKERNATGARKWEDQCKTLEAEQTAREAAESAYQLLLEQIADRQIAPPPAPHTEGAGGHQAATDLVVLQHACDEAARVLRQFPPESSTASSNQDEDEAATAASEDDNSLSSTLVDKPEITCASAALAMRTLCRSLLDVHGSKICIHRFAVGEVAMFFPVPRKNPSDPQEYVAFSDQRHHMKHFLADESIALIGKSKHFKEAYVLGRIVHKDKQVADAQVARRLCLRSGTEYFAVTVAAVQNH